LKEFPAVVLNGLPFAQTPFQGEVVDKVGNPQRNGVDLRRPDGIPQVNRKIRTRVFILILDGIFSYKIQKTTEGNLPEVYKIDIKSIIIIVLCWITRTVFFGVHPAY